MASFTSFPDIPTLVSSVNEQVKHVSKDGSIDLDQRRALQATVQTLSLALETPGDTIQRIAYLVGSWLKVLGSSNNSSLEEC